MSHVCQKSSRYEKYKKKSKSIPHVPLLDLPLQEAGCEFHFGTLYVRQSQFIPEKKSIENGFQIVLSHTSKYKTGTMGILLQ